MQSVLKCCARRAAILVMAWAMTPDGLSVAHAADVPRPVSETSIGVDPRSSDAEGSFDPDDKTPAVAPPAAKKPVPPPEVPAPRLIPIDVGDGTLTFATRRFSISGNARLAGRRIDLSRTSGATLVPVTSTFADGSGLYRFDGLEPGSQDALWCVSTPGVSTCPASSYFCRTLVTGDATNVDFDLGCASVSGNVSYNGVRGLTSIRVQAHNPSFPPRPFGPGGFGSGGLRDAAGNYKIEQLLEGTYTLWPVSAGCSFSPQSQTITIPSAFSALTGVNFAAVCDDIYGFLTDLSGVGTSGATVTLTPSGRTTSDDPGQEGVFTFRDVPNGTYTVTPSRQGCTFAPPSRSVSHPTQTADFLEFTATCASISGNVGTPNVRVTAFNPSLPLEGPYRATSDASGNYRVFVGADSNYTVTPEPRCGGFFPSTRNVLVPANGGHPTGINFDPLQCVKGNVEVKGATVTATADGEPTRTATSDAGGNYSLSRIRRNKTYTVTVSRSGGCPFTPASRAVTVGSADVDPVNFRTVCADPRNAAFWRLGSSGVTSHNGMLDRAHQQACENGYHTQYFCAAAATAAAREKAEKAVRDGFESTASAKNHFVNGCSALDDLPLIGPFFTGPGGFLGGVDNLWFKRPCNNHDQGYQHGFDPAWNNEAWGGNGTKAEVDRAFGDDMSRVCGAVPNATERSLCHSFVALYEGAVVRFGGSFYYRDKNTNADGNPLPAPSPACSPELARVDVLGSLPISQTVSAVLRNPDGFCRQVILSFNEFPHLTTVTTQYYGATFSGGGRVKADNGNPRLCFGGDAAGEGATITIDFDPTVSEFAFADTLGSINHGHIGTLTLFGDGGTASAPINDGTVVRPGSVGKVYRAVAQYSRGSCFNDVGYSRDPRSK